MNEKKTYETVSEELAKEIIAKIYDLENTSSIELKPCCGIFANGYTFEGPYEVHICKLYYPNDVNTIKKYPHGYIEFLANPNTIDVYKAQLFKFKNGKVVFVD